jgi:predicted deacylase
MATDRLVPFARLPLTYDECRARFRQSADLAGLAVEEHPIDARGPHGQQLTIDVTRIGPSDADALLTVLSGVHGVEGFIASALQCDLIDRIGPTALPPGVAILIVHVVNPWGMSWERRQNESNVDLNRNWRRDDGDPVHNDAYDEIHHLACPATAELPDVDLLLASAAEVVAERGLQWVRDAITVGQYRHADGLHYGGERTEESNRIVESIAEHHVVGRDRVLVVDLHTGHGPRGEITLLSDQAPSSAQDEFFRRHFPDVRVEATVANRDSTTAAKSGQIANGIRALMPEGRCFSTSAEFGTASDLDQLAATYQSHWVHLHGDRTDPVHAAALRAYRECFTPDDQAWEELAFEQGRSLLDHALDAMVNWPEPAPST